MYADIRQCGAEADDEDAISEAIRQRQEKRERAKPAAGSRQP
jgi:hypothetical protein